MKFTYKRYGNTLRPVIPIRLVNGDKAIRYEVLVDSGADMCVFDAAIGEAINIPTGNGKRREVRGVGGKSSIYHECPVTLEIGGWEYDIIGGFMPAVAGRVMPYGIVGQIGFFEFFTVTFDWQKEVVALKQKE